MMRFKAMKLIIKNYILKPDKILTEVEGLLCTFTLVLCHILTVKSYLIHLESLSIFFSNMLLSNIIIFVTNRNPDNSFEHSSELFKEEFNKYLADICKSQNNFIICAGDFNINLLKYAEHTLTH